MRTRIGGLQPFRLSRFSKTPSETILKKLFSKYLLIKQTQINLIVVLTFYLVRSIKIWAYWRLCASDTTIQACHRAGCSIKCTCGMKLRDIPTREYYNIAGILDVVPIPSPVPGWPIIDRSYLASLENIAKLKLFASWIWLTVGLPPIRFMHWHFQTYFMQNIPQIYLYRSTIAQKLISSQTVIHIKLFTYTKVICKSKVLIPNRHRHVYSQ